MAGQIQIKEVTRTEREQDCGCGCGGDLCGTGWQELVFVSSRDVRDKNELTAKECRCGCDGSCGCSG